MIETELPHWRSDIDALTFQPAGHEGFCVIHRRAFSTLLKASASPQQCIDFYRRHHEAFQAAARDKMGLKRLAATANFHLTSRDVGRRLRLEVASPAKTG